MEPDLKLALDKVYEPQKFEPHWANWANSDPMLAQQLEHYREYKTVDDVLILRREDGP